MYLRKGLQTVLWAFSATFGGAPTSNEKLLSLPAALVSSEQRVGFHNKCPQSLLISNVKIQQIQIRLKLLVQSIIVVYIMSSGYQAVSKQQCSVPVKA
jgi:hypothetical protein